MKLIKFLNLKGFIIVSCVFISAISVAGDKTRTGDALESKPKDKTKTGDALESKPKDKTKTGDALESKPKDKTKTGDALESKPKDKTKTGDALHSHPESIESSTDDDVLEKNAEHFTKIVECAIRYACAKNTQALQKIEHEVLSISEELSKILNSRKEMSLKNCKKSRKNLIVSVSLALNEMDSKFQREFSRPLGNLSSKIQCSAKHKDEL